MVIVKIPRKLGSATNSWEHTERMPKRGWHGFVSELNVMMESTGKITTLVLNPVYTIFSRENS